MESEDLLDQIAGIQFVATSRASSSALLGIGRVAFRSIGRPSRAARDARERVPGRTPLNGPERWRWDRSRDKMETAMPHHRIRRKRIPVDAPPRVPCQYDWRDGCSKTATWRVGCGPDVRFYCDSHEGPPCGGMFFDEFVITPDTTREELAGVARCGAHRIYSVSGRDVHDLRCCACGEWIGDTRDPAPVAGGKLCKAWTKISLPTITPRIPQLGSTSWP